MNRVALVDLLLAAGLLWTTVELFSVGKLITFIIGIVDLGFAALYVYFAMEAMKK